MSTDPCRHRRYASVVCICIDLTAEYLVALSMSITATHEPAFRPMRDKTRNRNLTNYLGPCMEDADVGRNMLDSILRPAAGPAWGDGIRGQYVNRSQRQVNG